MSKQARPGGFWMVFMASLLIGSLGTADSFAQEGAGSAGELTDFEKHTPGQNDGGCGSGDADPTTQNPVQLWDRAKVERATDLVVELPGNDFTFMRSHSSRFEAWGISAFPYISGANWLLDTMESIQPIGLPGTDREVRIHYRNNSISMAVFEEEDELAAFQNDRWLSGGGTTRYFKRGLIERDDDWLGFSGVDKKFPTFALHEEGQYVKHFWKGIYNVDPPNAEGEVHLYGAGVEEAPSWALGLLAEIQDPYGNRMLYEYEHIEVSKTALYSHASMPLVSKVRCVDRDGNLNATIYFDYHDTLTGYDNIGDPEDDEVKFPGRLRRLRVERPDGQGVLETQRVVYYYWSDLDAHHGSNLAVYTGTEGDLMQVVNYTRVDNGPTVVEEYLPDTDDDTDNEDIGYPARTQITQYRYQVGPVGTPGGGTGTCLECTGLTEDLIDELEVPEQYTISGGHTGTTYLLGHPHMLRTVTLPESVEFACQRYNEQEPASNYRSLEQFAIDLYQVESGSVILTSEDVTVAGLASKHIVSYDLVSAGLFEKYGAVETQLLQSTCGCGGGTGGLGLLQRYEQVEYSSGGDVHRSTRMNEYIVIPGQSGYSFHTRKIWDLSSLSDPDITANSATPYLVNEIIADAENDVSGTSYWVTEYVRDSDARVEFKLMPSAMSGDHSDLLTTTGLWGYSRNTTDGLVHAYAYNEDNRPTEVRIHEGFSSGLTVSNCDLVRSIEYDSTHPWLVSKVRRYREEGEDGAITFPTGSDDDVEDTVYTYKLETNAVGDFDPPFAVIWRHEETEVELVAENGPTGGGTYSHFEVYNDRGENEWTIETDGAHTYREFDTTTGMVTKVEQNAAEPTNWNDFTGLQTELTNAGISDDRNSDGGKLTSTWEYDELGREIESTSPAGVKMQHVREMRVTPVAFNLDHPHTGKDPLYYYAEVELPHITDTAGTGEFGGLAVVRYYNASNRHLGENGFVPKLTSGDYDLIGVDDYLDTTKERTKSLAVYNHSGLLLEQQRWEDVSDDLNGFYTTEYAYDGAGRLIKVTDSLDTITEYDYDHLDRMTEERVGTSSVNMVDVASYYYDSAGTSTSGVGDGNLTLVSANANSTSGDDRDSVFTYDYRNRRIKTKSPLAPHETVVYDNLDRLIQRGLTSASAPADQSSFDSTDTNRGFYEDFAYNQRGMLYQTRRLIDPDEDPDTGDVLQWLSWYDSVGREIAQWSPNAPGVKTEYDGLSRATVEYTTDRSKGVGNPRVSELESLSHADASSITDDTILEQVNYTYGDDGDSDADQITLLATHQRTHDSTHYGDLLAVGAPTDGLVTTWRGWAYDDAGRLENEVDFGTGLSASDILESGGATATLEPESPSSDDLQTSYTYNERDLIETVTVKVNSSTDYVTKYFYDDLNREVGMAENHDEASVIRHATNDWGWETDYDGSNFPATEDVDRVTITAYDGIDNVTYLVAYNYDGTTLTEQETEYVYGVTTTDMYATSDLNSNSLLRQVFYPDSGGTSSDSVRYGYNRQGELIGMRDQNSTEHEYSRDKLGRVDTDDVTNHGTGIDTAIDELTLTYDGMGRLGTTKSLDGSTVVNAVEFGYNGLWQVNKVKQNPNGDLGGADESSVDYDFDQEDVATGNYSRLDAIKYPTVPGTGSRTQLDYSYGSTSDDDDDLISRFTGLSWNGPEPYLNGPTTHTVGYDHLGMGTVILKDLETAEARLDRHADHKTTTETAGEYPGYDKFGRVRQQLWVKDSWTSTKPAIVDLQYLYDHASNITDRRDMRAINSGAVGSKLASRDEQYSYDGLLRLKQADRGKYTTSFAVAGSRGQRWELDALGNWQGFAQNLNGAAGTGGFDEAADYSDDRTHNDVNETGVRTISDPRTTGSTGALTLVHDAAGNLTSREVNPDLSGGDDKWVYVYDAWNRLVEVNIDPDGATAEYGRVRYGYNGLHWRTTREANTDDSTNGTLEDSTLHYYDSDWRLLEERFGGALASFAETSVTQRVWCPNYIDALIFAQTDTDLTDDFTDSDGLYTLCDRKYDVVVVLSDTGTLKERVRYTAYGVARYSPLGDINGDGVVDSSDLGAVIASYFKGWAVAAYDVDADFFFTGIVSTGELGTVTGNYGNGSSSDEGSLSFVGNSVGYSGYLYDEIAGLSLARHRWYSGEMGRWVSRDPIGYADSLLLYEYVRSDPFAYTDPQGEFILIVIGVGFTAYALYKTYKAIDEFSDALDGAQQAMCEGQKRRDEDNNYADLNIPEDKLDPHKERVKRDQRRGFKKAVRTARKGASLPGMTPEGPIEPIYLDPVGNIPGYNEFQDGWGRPPGGGPFRDNKRGNGGYDDDD